MNWQSGLLRRGAVAGGGVLVVAGVVVLVVTTTTPGTSEAQPKSARSRAAAPPATGAHPTTTSTPQETSPAPPSEPPPSQGPVPTPVAEVFHGFRTVSAQALQAGKVDPAALGRVAQGFVQGEIAATAAEFAKNGWHQEGAPTVVWSHTVERHLDAQPPSVTIEACVDSSDVRILDQHGKPVLGTTDKPPRVPNLYTLVKTHGTWKVTGHSFPRQPTC